MCLNPSYVWISRGPNPEQVPVPCKLCWRCKANRVNDYVARSLCEATVSLHTCAVTLTYAPRDDLADKVVHPPHFQAFIRALRRGGHKVRYLVAGEYGEKKGRAHFHAILFFTDLKPRPEFVFDKLGGSFPSEVSSYGAKFAPFSREIPQAQNCHIMEWPHGHIFADWSTSEASVRYVCKYLLSDSKQNSWFSLSKKPALGAVWFAQKAALAASFGVLPSSFEYSPPAVSSSASFVMMGATRRDYLNAITQDPAMRSRMSEWVQKTFDKHARKRAVDLLANQPPQVLAQIMADSMEFHLGVTKERASVARYRRYLDFTDSLNVLASQPIDQLSDDERASYGAQIDQIFHDYRSSSF